MLEVVCSHCGVPRENQDSWRCECGSPFTVLTDVRFDADGVVEVDASIWRYRRFLPPVRRKSIVSLGEGGTPFVAADFENRQVLLKLDYLMPTGSFKDRGSSVLISTFKDSHSTSQFFSVVEDSSGNAGASIAAYCGRGGIPCQIYAPKSTPKPKALQIEEYGARLRKIAGDRMDASRAAQKATKTNFYASHIWNPFFIEGTKTVSYELAEKLGWKSPDVIFAPTSNGTLLLGLVKGFRQLQESDVIEKMPKVVAVQPSRVPTLYRAFHGLPRRTEKDMSTVAQALTTKDPPRLREMVEALKSSGGDCEIVRESEILESCRELGRRGFFVEPSSALGFAACKKWSENGKLDQEQTVVLPLTGTGLKSLV